MSDEEKKAIDELKEEINKPVEVPEDRFNTFILYNIESAKIVLNLIEKKSKEIEELKETLKCTQNSWYEDTKVIEKQYKEIEELKNITKSYDSFLGDEKIVIADKKFFVNGYFQENFVRKDKIKAKIEEFKNIIGVN